MRKKREKIDGRFVLVVATKSDDMERRNNTIAWQNDDSCIMAILVASKDRSKHERIRINQYIGCETGDFVE